MRQITIIHDQLRLDILLQQVADPSQSALRQPTVVPLRFGRAGIAGATGTTSFAGSFSASAKRSGSGATAASAGTVMMTTAGAGAGWGGMASRWRGASAPTRPEMSIAN